MLKPVYLKVNRHTDKEDGEDPEVKPYNYENPNDSLYCSQIGVILDILIVIYLLINCIFR